MEPPIDPQDDSFGFVEEDLSVVREVVGYRQPGLRAVEALLYLMVGYPPMFAALSGNVFGIPGAGKSQEKTTTLLSHAEQVASVLPAIAFGTPEEHKVIATSFRKAHAGVQGVIPHSTYRQEGGERYSASSQHKGVVAVALTMLLLRSYNLYVQDLDHHAREQFCGGFSLLMRQTLDIEAEDLPTSYPLIRDQYTGFWSSIRFSRSQRNHLSRLAGTALGRQMKERAPEALILLPESLATAFAQMLSIPQKHKSGYRDQLQKQLNLTIVRGRRAALDGPSEDNTWPRAWDYYATAS